MTAIVPDVPALYTAGLLRDIDVQFAHTVARLAQTNDPLILLALAVASRAPGAGHVCAELGRMHQLVRMEGGNGQFSVVWPDPDIWMAALRTSSLVRTAADDGVAPLVLDGGRLYLHRYWQYEQRLISAIENRALVVRDDVDEALLRDGLRRLFAEPDAASAPDQQRMAAAVAVLRNLTILTGGPGTGKTTTVVRMLALLLEQARVCGTTLRIALAAPTGKAAARMMEAVRSGAASLPVDADIRNAIPAEAFTVHRLLRRDYRRPTRFRHDAANPLDVDVLVVDEASMVDLALMVKLLDAIPPQSRLILVGDQNQLASVEAGAILGDICGDREVAFSRPFADRTTSITGEPAPTDATRTQTGLHDCVVRLTRSHRFDAGSSIGMLASAINDGDADRVLSVLVPSQPDTGNIRLVSLGRAAGLDVLREDIVRGYREMCTAPDPQTMLQALDRFRVLCAHRVGLLGSAAVNVRIKRWLEEDGFVTSPASQQWYHGQPFIVTENDYTVNVFNGDTGIIREHHGRLSACLWAQDGDTIRELSPARLPAHEPAYAMTVHKSQGSEFDDVVLVLPDTVSRVLTRELLYTGISRARRTITVAGTADVIQAAISERVQRASGVRERLWGA